MAPVSVEALRRRYRRRDPWAVDGVHTQLVAGNLGDNAVLKGGLDVLYWLVPHQLVGQVRSDPGMRTARAPL
jgi:hypothetical protein